MKSKYLQPDYPYKHFSDKRNNYVLLMMVLATDAAIF
ncbi:hypothetical protein HNQ91_004352 [Filimonas zeae]|nr:hypothetical protein [Filimonas zeae]